MQSKHFKALFRSDWLPLGLLFLGFILLKIKHLALPCFWDEAWSYFPAIQAMAEAGPSLLPDSIDPELYRGHPLLFYFFASAWMRATGGSIMAMRFLPMLLSMALLASLYFFGKKHFGKKVAFATTVTFSIQSVFLAQSSFLLPEVLVALLTVLAIDAYFSGKNWATCLWLSLLLLTKESGVVLWGALVIWELGTAFKNRNTLDARLLADRLWPFGLAAVPVGLFFMLQKLWLGWLFFPEHIGYLVFDLGEIMRKIRGILAYLFIDMGRNLLTIFGSLAFLFLWVKKKEIGRKASSVLGFSGVFLLLYLVFSAMNFYTPRYLLCVLPFMITGFVFAIEQAMKVLWLRQNDGARKLMALSIVLVVGVNNLGFTFLKMRGNDHNLGYADAIKTHQKVVGYLEAMQAQDMQIAAGFLTKTNLENEKLGYLKDGKPFTKITGQIDDFTSLAVVTSTEFDTQFQQQINAKKGKLRYRFEAGKAWAEVYEF